jgi:plasmid stabilization system protein ParE
MTPKKLVFHPPAVDEAEAAALWYHERSPRAAARFTHELDRVIESIRIAPSRSLLGPQGTRKVKVPRVFIAN